LYIILLYFQTWTQRIKGDTWPWKRYGHSATCVGYAGQHQRLVISGGIVSVTFDDMWILDPQSGKMEKVGTALEN